MGALALALLTGWLLVAVYALHAVMPYNPLRLPGSGFIDMRLLLPEGWAFFTRNPREPDFYVYLREPDGRWRPAADMTRFRLGTALGLDRFGRAMGLEVGLLLERAEKARRASCEREAQECLEQAPVALTVSNPGPRAQLCGSVGMHFRKPVPWAWSRSHQREPIELSSEVLRLEVQC